MSRKCYIQNQSIVTKSKRIYRSTEVFRNVKNNEIESILLFLKVMTNNNLRVIYYATAVFDAGHLTKLNIQLHKYTRKIELVNKN